MKSKSGPRVAVKVLDEAKGEVEAVFATLNAIDKDNDVTLPGAFGQQNVRVSAFNHTSWKGELPVGKGTISEQGSDAILKSQFFMDTTAGREHFYVVRDLGDLMEWSYGYDVLDRADGKWPLNDPQGKAVQFLKQLKVHEVSPVILGAGVDTRTLETKQRDKGAIPYSETGTTDVTWDAGIMRRRVSAASAPLRALHAWVDSSGDANMKSSYKFPHHMVSETGAVGAANTRACSAGIAVLNGGRGGSSIPDSDRQQVYNHLAHHIRDAGGDPAPLKSWIEYQGARKEAFKQALTQGQVDDAKSVIGQILALLNSTDSSPDKEAVDELIDQLEEAIGVVEPMMDSLDFDGGVKLFDHLAWGYTELEIVSDRVAKAVAQRAENGQTLSEPTLDVVKMILSECDRLREAVAIQPRKSADPQKEHDYIESIFRDSRALLALTRGAEVQ